MPSFLNITLIVMLVLCSEMHLKGFACHWLPNPVPPCCCTLVEKGSIIIHANNLIKKFTHFHKISFRKSRVFDGKYIFRSPPCTELNPTTVYCSFWRTHWMLQLHYWTLLSSISHCVSIFVNYPWIYTIYGTTLFY